MDIVIANNAGFCFGVTRALELANRAAEDRSRPVHTLGALIHNPQEVARLEAAGVHQVESLDDVPEGTVILSAHGVDPSVEAEARARGLEVIDATCPFVLRAHEHIRQARRGRLHRRHPRRPGPSRSRSAWPPARRARPPSSPPRRTRPRCPFGGRYGLVVQTTQRPERLREVAGVLAERSRELRVFNTICEATMKRQESARDLAVRAST